MYPDLFHIGSIPIKSYGVLLAASFFLGVMYVYWQSKKLRKRFEPLLMIAYIMIFGGVIGARLTYVLLHTEEFTGHWIDTINPFQAGTFGIAGLNLYGGVLLGMIGALLFCLWRRLPILDVFDIFAPTIGIGLAITRVGCFLNGCCFGTPTSLPWGVTFPPGSIPYFVFGSQPIHPAQLYSSLYGIILFVGLHYLLNHRRFVGQVTAVLLMSEAVCRYALEYVRYYEPDMYISVFGMHPTFNMLIAIVLFLTGAALYLLRRRNRRELAFG
jgi:phosphatidylglycerol:prolipoprotein diacylglycerol transferase